MSRSPALILLVGSVAFVAATDACALQASAPPTQGPLQGYDSIDAYATAMRPLKTALASPNESVQHSAMAALRQLRDPALAPLLERLRTAERWTLPTLASRGRTWPPFKHVATAKLGYYWGGDRRGFPGHRLSAHRQNHSNNC